MIDSQGRDTTNPLTLTIKCDGDETNNSFTMDYYGDDGITIKRNRNVLNIYIKPNFTQFEKNYTIYCEHANDSSVYLQIEIVQEAEEYTVEIEQNAIQFSSENIEEKKVNVKVQGGSKKWRIKSIYRFHREEWGEEKEIFDNGVILSKSDYYLMIKSYGRPFLEAKDYYILTICHKDDDSINKEIMIQYSTEAVKKVRKKRDRKMIAKVYQQSDIYLPTEEKIKHLTMVKEEDDISENEHTIDLDYEFSKRDEIIIHGTNPKTIIFSIKENGNESNLMAHCYSTGSWWCNMNISQSDIKNRFINITINNKPLSIRKAYVKIYIIDKPDVYKEFYITNMP